VYKKRKKRNMRKRIDFINNKNKDVFFIEIINGKIRKYHGKVIVESNLYNKSDIHNSYDVDYEIILEKISKYDRKLKNIKSNYKINNKDLEKFGIYQPTISLNLIERLIIKFHKKETIIQEKEIKRLIFTTIIITLPASIITTISTNFITNQHGKKQESKKEVSNDVKTDTTTTKIKIKM